MEDKSTCIGCKFPNENKAWEYCEKEQTVEQRKAACADDAGIWCPLK